MLDPVDRRILEVLLQNARRSLKDVARLVNLSSPSVAERIRRLEERGVIRAYTLDVDPAALGYSLQALVRVRPLPGRTREVLQALSDIPSVWECDKVTGDDCYVARIFLRSIDELDEVLDRVAEHAQTNSSIVKSQPIRRRVQLRPDAG